LLIGDPVVFAVESRITQAYHQVGLCALGYFVIYIRTLCYGRRSADATMLACSLDEVQRRVAMRGNHTAPFADENNAGRIADAFRSAVYGVKQSAAYFGIPLLQFRNLLYSNHLVWAPDGDEAFDDGSYVLQFDIRDHVRLVAFKSVAGGSYDPATLRDVRLESDDFYGLLANWHSTFEKDWASSPKVDGTHIG